MPHADPARARLLVLDCDGVLTDGSINYDDEGREFKRFYVRDGFAIRLWQKAGFQIAVVTGRGGPAMRRRLDDHDIDLVIEQTINKAGAPDVLAAQTGVPLEEMAYLGDDWPDLPAMGRVGYPMAVADAEPAVLAAAAWITPRPGGRGAVRDAIEHLLNAKGLLDDALTRFASADPASTAANPGWPPAGSPASR